jgi:beta-lactamase superfamily II metal-dependent hydrolase
MTFELHVFSAGNADALALKLPDSRWGVVDCGLSDGNAFVDYLHENGCDDLAFIVLTHPDADHYLGLSAVFSAFQQIDKFWMPDDYHHGKIALRKLMLDHVHPRWKSEHLEAKHAVPGKKIYTHKSSNFEITALSPLEKDVWKVNFDIYRAKSKGTRAGSANRLSIVLHIKYNQTYALLGSDAEKVTWQVIADSPYLPMEGEQKIDIFKVPHHGSKDAWDKGKL